MEDQRLALNGSYLFFGFMSPCHANVKKCGDGTQTLCEGRSLGLILLPLWAVNKYLPCVCITQGPVLAAKAVVLFSKEFEKWVPKC